MTMALSIRTLTRVTFGVVQPQHASAVCTALAALVLSAEANATTHVSGSITADTTWTLAASPYVVDGNVRVRAGVMLTIEPGVVVKFNGQFRTLFVDGSLTAVGTPEQRIVFTSIQDDSIAGDTGGDGASAGAPGQWYGIRLMDTSAGFIQYADIQYGGYGSANHAYGGIGLQDGAWATFDNDRFLWNQRSGLQVGINSGAIVSNCEFAGNANGISTANAWLDLSSTTIHGNSDSGLFIVASPAYTGSPIAVTGNQIANNGVYGVKLWVKDVAGPSQPYGHGNDIVGNGSRELYSLYNQPTLDWTNNYWGLGVVPTPCPWAPPSTTQIHLAYLSDIDGSPPNGPVSYSTYVLPGSNPPLKCAADYVLDVPHAFVPFFP